MVPDPLLGEQNERPGTELRLGQAAVDRHGVMQVLVGGIPQACRYLDGTVLADGDPVIIAFMGGSTGQSEAVVLGRTIASPAVAEPPAPPPPTPGRPPGAAITGTAVFAAIDSATARVGSGWNSPSGQNLWQGSWGGPSFAGAWFYGTGPASLAGRTITRAQILLPARRRMGNYDDPATINLYAHNSAHRPGGDVTRTVGPHGITLAPGSGGGWVDIPGSFAAQIIAGGGVGIAGNPYAGLAGRGENPQSGLLSLDWRI